MADYLAEYGGPIRSLARLALPPSRVLAADLGVDILAGVIAGL